MSFVICFASAEVALDPPISSTISSSFQGIFTCILPSTKVVEAKRDFINLFSRNKFSLHVQTLVGLTPRRSW